MKVKELIKHLEALPQDKDVAIFWDGGQRGDIDGIVNDNQVVIVGDWCIYRDGTHRRYEEDNIVYVRGDERLRQAAKP